MNFPNVSHHSILQNIFVLSMNCLILSPFELEEDTSEELLLKLWQVVSPAK